MSGSPNLDIALHEARKQFLEITDECEAARKAWQTLLDIPEDKRKSDWMEREETARLVTHDLWMRWEGANEIITIISKQARLLLGEVRE